MNRSIPIRVTPVLVALVLAAGCAGASDDENDTETASPGQGRSSVVCDGYSQLKTAVEDLRATPLDTTGTADEIQAQLDELGDKAATVKAGLDKLSTVSDGPGAAAVGAMNEKADALRESLTEAKADAQESLGPEITEAQNELNASYDEVTSAFDKECPSS